MTISKVTLPAGCYGNSSAWHPGNRFSGHDSAEHRVTERERGGGMEWCRRKSRGLAQRWWTGQELKQAIVEERHEGGIEKMSRKRELVRRAAKSFRVSRVHCWGNDNSFTSELQWDTQSSVSLHWVVVRWLSLQMHGDGSAACNTHVLYVQCHPFCFPMPSYPIYTYTAKIQYPWNNLLLLLLLVQGFVTECCNMSTVQPWPQKSWDTV